MRMTYERITQAPSLLVLAVMHEMEKAAAMPFKTIDEVTSHVQDLVSILLEDVPNIKQELRVFVAESATDDFGASVMLCRDKKMEALQRLARINCSWQEGGES